MPPDPREYTAQEEGESRVRGDKLAKENYEFLRRQMAKIYEHLRELERGIPGDKFDELTITSPGAFKEIRVAHDIEETPNRFDVTLPARGPWVVYRSRNDLADDTYCYFGTDAPKGARFVVRVWRMDPKLTNQDASAELYSLLNNERSLVVVEPSTLPETTKQEEAPQL